MSAEIARLSKKLDIHRGEFRLLILTAGEFSAKLSCTLVVESLKNNPLYEALSYVWGSEDEPRLVDVDATMCTVTRNLEVALRYLRYPDKDRTLWIDALCINQKDVEERNSQVRLMGDIYRSAGRVLMWIGEADEYSDKAFPLMSEVDSAFVDSEAAPDVWQFFSNASKRPYMSRVWVIQEFVLATQDPVVLCGHKQVLWSTFMEAYKTLALEFFTNIDMFKNDAEGRIPGVFSKLKYDLFDELRGSVKQQGGADLRQLFINSRTSETSEPRDRVYGLVQMLDDEDRLHFDIDYKKPTALIFAEAMELIFKQGDGPQFIANMWCPSKYNPSIANLPSWVPDFTSQTSGKAAPFPLNISFHPPFPRSVSGPGADAQNGRVLDDLRTLEVEVLQVDIVDNVLVFGETINDCIAQLGEVERMAKAASMQLIHNKELRQFYEKSRSSEPLWRILISNKKYVSGYDVAPESYADMYQQIQSKILTHGSNATEIPISEFERALESHLPHRTFFTTKNGLLGIGMPTVQKDDEVTIWFGANVPFVVRQCENDDTKSILIGAAYVSGIMEGQMIDELYCEDLLDSRTLLMV